MMKTDVSIVLFKVQEEVTVRSTLELASSRSESLGHGPTITVLGSVIWVEAPIDMYRLGSSPAYTLRAFSTCAMRRG